MTGAPRSLVGEVLLVTWALVLYYLVTHQRLLHDAAGYQAYGFAVLFWLALSAWGLGRMGFVLFRAAFRSPTGCTRRHHSDSRFTASYEDDHDDNDTDRDNEERNHRSPLA